MAEKDRTDLIAAIVSLVRNESLTDDAHAAALTLIGWLARRRASERPCTCGVFEAREQLLAVQPHDR